VTTESRRITISVVERLQSESIVWDTAVKGFGCRRQRKDPIYFLKARFGGRQRWFAIGPHGSPWTPETARNEARRLLGEAAAGRDPVLARVRRDKKEVSKGGRELWFINHLRGEQSGKSFSFNTEKGVAHDFADPGFDTDLIGLVCLAEGLGEGKEARLEAMRVIADKLKIERPWFLRGGTTMPACGQCRL